MSEKEKKWEYDIHFGDESLARVSLARTMNAKPVGNTPQEDIIISAFSTFFLFGIVIVVLFHTNFILNIVGFILASIGVLILVAWVLYNKFKSL